MRKDWTMTEMLECGKRMERMAAIKGVINMKSGITLDQNLPKVDSLKEAAKSIDVSREQYRKMKAIEDNRTLLSAEDFANWDEGKLSTNKAYNKAGIDLEKELGSAARDRESIEIGGKLYYLESAEKHLMKKFGRR